MTYDVIIIGSGQAGVPLAARLAAAGRRVLIAERGELGGTCVNTGCTPTKTMIASARVAHVARGAGRLGVRTGNVEVDLPAIVDRKDGIVQRWRDGVAKRLQHERITLARSHARLVSGGAVEVAGQRHEAETIVINTGARPVTPRLDGLQGVPWLHNGTAMQLRKVPEHLLVLGGGYIGCELGQMFRRFGARVTLVDHHPRLLSREDPDISGALESALRAEGLEFCLGEKVASVSNSNGAISISLGSGKVLTGSHLLVAAGRRPNTDDLGCEAAGVALDEHGAVKVDGGYRTSAKGIYAVGDATGGPQFTHSSWDDHRLLFEALQGRPGRGRDDRLVPYAVFTDPQVAGVGLSEAEAKKRGLAYEVATMPFGNIARAIEIDETAGLLKVLIEPGSERIIGAALVGAEAGELIHIFASLMQARATLRAVADAEFVHPTFAEGVQSLVMKLSPYRLRDS